MREVKRSEYGNVANTIKDSVKFVKKELKARKGKMFKNLAVEKCANDYVDAVEKVLDKM